MTLWESLTISVSQIAETISPRMGTQAAEAQRSWRKQKVVLLVNTHPGASLPSEWMMSCQVTSLEDACQFPLMFSATCLT